MEAIKENLRKEYNSSGNATTPFDEDEAIKDLYLQWMRGQNLPEISILIYSFTWLLLRIVILIVRYTLWHVVATLAIVEAPQVSINAVQERGSLDQTDDKIQVSQSRTITTTTRGTLHHLYKKAGLPSFWRGFSLCMPYGIVAALFASPFILTLDSLSLPEPVKDIAGDLIDVLVTTLLANWWTTFTHIIITEPTYRVWYRRFPPLHTFKSVWLATAICRLVELLAFNGSRTLLVQLGLNKINPISMNPQVTLRQHLTFWLIWLAVQVVRIRVLVPCGVAVVRIHASLLPEEEETIVPVNRVFDKRHMSGLLTESKGITFWSAWKSFDRADQRHIYVLYAKFVLAEIFIRAVFTPFLRSEAWPSLTSMRPDIFI